MRLVSTVLATCLGLPSLAVVLLGGPSTASVGTALVASSEVIGSKVADFVLPDHDGAQTDLADFADKRAVVLFTMGTGCPISNLYLTSLMRLQALPDVQVLGINSNDGTSLEDLHAHAEEFQVTFPVLLDADGRLAGQLGARRTAEVFLLDEQRIVRYHGRVDDRFGYTYKKISATRNDLDEALSEVLAGKPVSVETTEPLGCLITRTKGALAVPASYRHARSSSVVGHQIPLFVLPDQTGTQVGLGDFNAKPVVVLFLMGTECPVSNVYMAEMARLQELYAGQGLQVIGLHSSAGEELSEVAAHAAEYEPPFPVLLDAEQLVAEVLDAERTAEVYLLDSQRIVRYQGRIDDRFSVQDSEEPSRHDLEQALLEVLAGKPVSTAATAAKGCAILRSEEERDTPITYTEHVASILQRRCQECHRPGEVAPFSLLTYEDAYDWTDMMREVVLQRRMPPWHADPRFGEFSSDRSLTKEELDTLIGWIDAGAPRGDEQHLPPAKEYLEGWRIDEPDLIYELPEEVTIPADGVVPYLDFTVPTNLEEDVWISQIEARPDNREVVHHITLRYLLPGERLREQGGYLISFAPGELPFVFPPGSARKLPAGALLRITMHYTPTGKVAKDRSRIGIVLYKEKDPPKYTVATGTVFNQEFVIPPHDPYYRAEATYKFRSDSLLLTLQPHMHLRGKDFSYTAVYPDGRREFLLFVPNWDFNWQNTYRLTTPIPMPKGTLLEVVAHFDNSAANPANPDPARATGWGNQTWDDMLVGWFIFSTAVKDSGRRVREAGLEKKDLPAR